MALGNVVGSNTANVLLVLGIPAVISGISTKNSNSKEDYWFMIAASVLFVVLCFLGPLFYWQGLVLLAGLSAFLSAAFVKVRRSRRAYKAAASACCV